MSSFRNFSPWILLAWCLFFSPSALSGPLGNSTALNLPLIGTSILLSTFLAARIWKGVRCAESKTPLGLLSIIVFVALGLAAYPTQPGAAVQINYLWNWVILQAGVLVGVIAGFRSIVSSITALAAIESAYAVVKLAVDDDAFLSGTVTRATGTFGNPTPLYFVIGFGLLTALYLARNNQARSPILFVCVAALVTCLVFTWERGGVLAATLASAYLIMPALRKQYWLPLGIACLLTISLVMVRRSWGPTNYKSAHVSMQSRPELWQAGLKTFAQNPIAGVGIGNVSLGVTRTRNGLTGTAGVVEPKNGLLQILVETGTIGFVFASCLAWQCFRGIREITSEERRLIEALWIYTIIASSVDNPIMAIGRQAGTYLFGVLLAITLFAPQVNPSRVIPEPTRA